MQALVHYTTRAQFRGRIRDLVAQAQETPTRWQKPVAIVDEKTGKVLRMAHPNPDLLAGVLAPVGKWIRTSGCGASAGRSQSRPSWFRPRGGGEVM